MGFLDMEQEICPICAQKSAVTISLDRVLLLCECDTCTKFILKESTIPQLKDHGDFINNREKVSDSVKDYYQTHKRPLEILLNGDIPVTKNFKSFSAILTTKK